MLAKLFGPASVSDLIVLTQPVTKPEIARAAGALQPVRGHSPALTAHISLVVGFLLVEGEVCSLKRQPKTQMLHVLYHGF